MNRFIFKSYSFNKVDKIASFNYEFEDGQHFTEKVKFNSSGKYNEGLLDKALFLAFVLVGVSYYKTFPSIEVLVDFPIDEWQANFFNKVYQEGLGQFAYKNDLTRNDLAHFLANTHNNTSSVSYGGSGIMALQSGGKDSLLTASLLKKNDIDFTAWYLSNGDFYPNLLDSVGSKLIISNRSIDRINLNNALTKGALNGHVPITYIVQSLAVVQAILIGKSDILVSIAHEGEEPHCKIGDLLVSHQWSKTWMAEKYFSDYVNRYISPNIRIGSPLRCYSELRVAELFVDNAWADYGQKFSSCNISNYQQGNNNKLLSWCGKCSKCANSYLLFAPFLSKTRLDKIFGDNDLLTDSKLEDIFKGLLGIGGFLKPFECIGEIDELRAAYYMAISKGLYERLPFDVPESNFDYKRLYDAQDWAVKVLQ
ncbi:MAG: UDP-N-acetyl-alpha-D-muramoyl-L-alanyl-L-glutamate epimerase [Patescibacteria group bacterium]|nr:UDP-N-acetyl-alpha-D-muramoyl-L-alanyl-L-glutamate epimerase [Patescibacteria group bacterium]